KEMLDAYTAGINNYIASLSFRNYPIEYKLMGFKPEPWTKLKSALLLKYMADDLTGETDDIANTLLGNSFSESKLLCLFPEVEDITPVIPKGTVFEQGSLEVPQPPDDSNICVQLGKVSLQGKEETGKGSNNWVLSGSRTKSGKAILSND